MKVSGSYLPAVLREQLNIEREFDMVMLMGCQDDHVQIASTVTKWKEKLM
jgi:hypothetical protein